MNTSENKEIVIDFSEEEKNTFAKPNNSATGNERNSIDQEEGRLNTTEQLELQTYKKKYQNIDIAEVKSNDEICKE